MKYYILIYISIFSIVQHTTGREAGIKITPYDLISLQRHDSDVNQLILVTE